MATQKLNVTRDQLATFLKSHELIKQFEALFVVADAIAPDVVQAVAIQAGNADATANEALAQIIRLAQYASSSEGNTAGAVNEALAQIIRLAQDSTINSSVASQKSIEALDCINRLSTSLELLALAPVRNNIELSHDVNGTLPLANLPASMRSNQVLTWLSM